MSIWAIDIETLEKPIDEEMVAAYEATVREELVQEKAIENRVQKYKERWKFTPEGAKLLAFGAIDMESTDRFRFFASDNEHEVVTELLAFLSQEWPRKLVAYNGNRFDFPVMATAICRNIEVATFVPVDYKLYDLADYPMGKYVGVRTLASFAKMLGVGTEKTGDGAQVVNYWESDKANGTTLLQDYCLTDCKIVKDCYRKLSIFYPM